MNEIFRLIKLCGYTIYQRNEEDNWCYYTDGVNIGYAQWSELAGCRLCTVHKASRESGSGFIIVDRLAEIDEQAIKLAAEVHVPRWANSLTCNKYKNIEEFLNESEWNLGYKKVDHIVDANKMVEEKS